MFLLHVFRLEKNILLMNFSVLLRPLLSKTGFVVIALSSSGKTTSCLFLQIRAAAEGGKLSQFNPLKIPYQVDTFEAPF